MTRRRQRKWYPWWRQADDYIRHFADNLNELERLNATGTDDPRDRERRIELTRATRAVSRALLETAWKTNGHLRLAVIGKFYWQGNRSVEQVAEAVYYSPSQIKRIKSECALAVARWMGWKIS